MANRIWIWEYTEGRWCLHGRTQTDTLRARKALWEIYKQLRNQRDKR